MARSIKSSSELAELKAYSLEYEEYVPDCNAWGMVFRHKKSGARLCVLSNDDENKTFAIAFRTTPRDDTGVAHITEHSVLCGSAKFPPKDPFMELAKGSLNTFLNAFTFPDKTCYPVASCNDQDFANLMDVYMDAVLNPNIYRREEIFRQEGWRYELESKDAPITINGIVYSEMKGAFSNAESCLQRRVFHALYPDTTYGAESGGDPKAIPELTYEQFKDFHSHYYHPTNSYIYLYGNLDIEERLNWLDEEYLSKYDYQPVDSEVKDQAPVGVIEEHSFYSIGDDDPEESAGYLAWAFRTCEFDDLLTGEALEVLCDVLFNAPGAPVKEALIKAGIGQEISCMNNNDIKQPCVVLMVQNTEVDRLEEMKSILRNELEKIAREGVNKRSLLAAVNGSEFRYCEADFGYLPKGLEYGIMALNTWLYDDKQALRVLHTRERFSELRDRIESGYYEELINKYMLGSDSMVYYALAPKRGLAQEEEEKLAASLAAMKASMSDEEIEALIASTAALKVYQSEPSTPEELLTIPMLKREDIEKKAAEMIIEETEIGSVNTYFHDIETNGIVYFKLLFDADTAAFEEVKYITLASHLIQNIDTKTHSYLDLNNEVNIYTGGITTDLSVVNIRHEKDAYRPVWVAEAHVMAHSFDKMLELLKEELFETDYSSLVRIREYLAEIKARMQYSLAAGGNRTALGHAAAAVSSSARYREQISGISFYQTVCEMLNYSDEELVEETAKIRSSVEALLGRDNVTVDITCNRDIFEEIKTSVAKFIAELPTVREDGTEKTYRGPVFETEIVNDAFKTAGEVNFLALVGVLEDIPSYVGGRLAVVQNILSSEYLWNNIRVLGGAYGAGFTYNVASGHAGFYSYRDPHLAETLEVYKKAADFLREFDGDERTITKFVIGTIGGMDTPLSPAAKGARALNAVLSGVTPEMYQESRDSVINITSEDIRSTAEVLDRLLECYCICAVGCERTVNKNADMFDNVKNLL